MKEYWPPGTPDFWRHKQAPVFEFATHAADRVFNPSEVGRAHLQPSPCYENFRDLVSSVSAGIKGDHFRRFGRVPIGACGSNEHTTAQAAEV